MVVGSGLSGLLRGLDTAIPVARDFCANSLKHRQTNVHPNQGLCVMLLNRIFYILLTQI